MEIFSTVLDDSGILTLTIDIKHKSMNVFNQQVMQEFNEIYHDIENNNNIKAVIVISGKKECFIAGADIKMLQKVQTAEEGTAIVVPAHQLLQKISHSTKPFIAAIDGVCLGAGYEFCLACHYRIASNNKTTKIGLPEVMLGLLPGATGTTKLSRLIELPAALDLILTGKQLDTQRALQLGMIDEVVATSILGAAAKAAAYKLIGQKNHTIQRKTSLKQKIFSMPFIRDIILDKARKQVLKKTHGLYPAPLTILDLLKQNLTLPLPQALALEAKAFGQLTVTPEAKQLITIYFATTELKKTSFTNHDIAPAEINKIGILGGGLMGAGIATVSIDKAKTSVRMKDIHYEGLLSAQRYIDQYYQKRIRRHILSPEQAKKNINRFTSSLDYSGFSQCQLIIEAVFEDITLKHNMLSEIESLGNDNLIFASNTSLIPIREIAAKSQRPEQVIGMHYFSPVEKMPLLEIIKHPNTSEQTIATAVNFGRKQGKMVIVVNDSAGFYVNRILIPYLNAAMDVGLEGIPLDKIDRTLVAFGFPVGPFKLLDEVGIDVGSKILPILEKAFGERMKGATVDGDNIQQRFIHNKRLGKKVKKGFYRYDNPKHFQQIDPTVYPEMGIQHTTNTSEKTFSEQTIIERCLYPMLNEAAMCLDEGIINNARDGDIGAIFGIGFPPFLGGPFHYMDSLGIDNVVATLNKLTERYGGKYSVTQRLEETQKNMTRFYPHQEIETFIEPK
ncbi:multifunctional fatty acid oxidation complex subunit alpha [Candidatus Endobugula sertula]|uniref:enoyl-CoA hydratase n=1 Tax=Candidatus Endobugula sertula TaxID=62101 RepID=A0A1D2QNQ8_9GAMM|nr:multifunctional fatty acid oxidation complex subunit alpha [Candidatus Endobugula sertula]